ncbi:hypothetical protein ACH518_00365 (plasmid) [Methylomonas sp. HW2-6]|uniref:hypothetical protein n=1 Tax=Methylomonas sp. HW2-6 TaxID=3376687 RepID=UPI004042BEA3
MGYALSWLAIKGKTVEAIHQQLGLSTTGKLSDYGHALVVGRQLHSGWYLMVAKGCDHKLISNVVVQHVSSNCTAIACSIEEHVMFSSSAEWNDGQQNWRIQHRGGDYGPTDLSFEGAPPELFSDLRVHYGSKQDAEGGKKAEVDWIFEIPLELAKSYVGFKHDEDIPGVEDGSFEILELSREGLLAAVSKPWWHLW